MEKNWGTLLSCFPFPSSFLHLCLSPFILVLSHCALFPSLFSPLPKVVEHIVGSHSHPHPLRSPSTSILTRVPRLTHQSQTTRLIHIFPLSTPLLLLSHSPPSFLLLHNTASPLLSLFVLLFFPHTVASFHPFFIIYFIYLCIHLYYLYISVYFVQCFVFLIIHLWRFYFLLHCFHHVAFVNVFFFLLSLLHRRSLV